MRRWMLIVIACLLPGCVHGRVCAVASTEVDGVRYEAMWESGPCDTRYSAR
jgi:hypothetical protein